MSLARPNRYQSFRLPGGSTLPGLHDTAAIWRRVGLPESLQGRSFLDVGCSTGAYLVEAVMRGASSVTGVDEAVDACAWTEFILRTVKDVIGADTPVTIVPRRYPWDGNPEVPPHDVVIALSVIHHVERPMAFLHALRRDTRGEAWLEWELWADGHDGVNIDAIPEGAVPHVPGVQWGRGSYPIREVAVDMLQTAGFQTVECLGKARVSGCGPSREVFRCR